MVIAITKRAVQIKAANNIYYAIKMNNNDNNREVKVIPQMNIDKN